MAAAEAGAAQPIPRIADFAKAEYHLGTQSKCGESEEHYRKAIATKRLGFLEKNAREYIARCLSEEGERDEAIAAYESLLAEGKLPGANELGYLYERRGDMARALRMYRRGPPYAQVLGMPVSDRIRMLESAARLPKGLLEEFQQAESLQSSAEGKRLLEAFADKHPKSPLASQAIKVLLHSVAEPCGLGKLDLETCRNAFRPLLLRRTDPELHHQIIASFRSNMPYYLASNQRKENQIDNQFLVDNLPADDVERALPLFELADDAYTLDSALALRLLSEFHELSTGSEDPEIVKARSKALEIQELIDSPQWQLRLKARASHSAVIGNAPTNDPLPLGWVQGMNQLRSSDAATRRFASKNMLTAVRRQLRSLQRFQRVVDSPDTVFLDENDGLRTPQYRMQTASAKIGVYVSAALESDDPDVHADGLEACRLLGAFAPNSCGDVESR
ncbi:MAG: hypothetical protein NTY77_11195 [Elusimicrobia bacterium]|nr:hypothetical protein [Elusimicrobiota bacterium]